jgi:hypothetical protein
MNRKTKRSLAISFPIVVLLILACLGLQIRDEVRDTDACSFTSELLYLYMAGHHLRSPTNWEDLRPYYTGWLNSPEGRLFHVQPFDELKRRVTIDFTFDPHRLQSAPQDRSKPARVVWPTRGESLFGSPVLANSLLDRKLRVALEDEPATTQGTP